MSDNILLRVSHDEALVLFEMLSRFRETNKLWLAHNAEFLALSEISAQLDKALVEPFQKNYMQLLGDAQNRLAEGFEGLAPGVVGSEA
jgi:hypothetical protein